MSSGFPFAKRRDQLMAIGITKTDLTNFKSVGFRFRHKFSGPTDTWVQLQIDIATCF
jgi:hypothetical protein